MIEVLTAFPSLESRIGKNMIAFAHGKAAYEGSLPRALYEAYAQLLFLLMSK